MCCSIKIQIFHQLNTPLHRWSFEHTQERGPGDPEFLRGLLVRGSKAENVSQFNKKNYCGRHVNLSMELAKSF